MIRIICAGRVKDAWLKEGIAEYLKRLQPYDRTEIVEVADEPAPANNSQAQNEQVKGIEGQRLLKQIRPSEYVILLDLKGTSYSSEQMAKKISDLQTHSRSQIAFVIGGSLGVSAEVIQRADLRWKLSDCTFPHQLCRLILCEQIYRCGKILHHEPYHK